MATTSIAGGLVGGLIGSIAAGVAILALDDGPGPAAVVWAKYLGDGDPTNYRTQGVVVHLLYGALAGGLFVALVGTLSLETESVAGAVLWAIAWSSLLLLVAVGFWSRLLIGDDPDVQDVMEMGAVHLAYGVLLGLSVSVAPAL